MLRTSSVVLHEPRLGRAGSPVSTQDDLDSASTTAMGDLFLDGQRREPICEPHDGCVLGKRVVCSMSCVRRSGMENTNQLPLGLVLKSQYPLGGDVIDLTS